MTQLNSRQSPLLDIKDLNVRFKTRDGLAYALNGVSLQLHQGEFIGIIGESGSGKSLTAMSVIRLIQTPPGIITANRLNYNGLDILTASEKQMRRIRGNEIAMIFQDPMTCLNPVLTIGLQMKEIVSLHMGLKGAALEKACVRLLEQVGISAAQKRMKAYPHQMSGGMRQRVMIAMAISCNPAILLADEPTTALDVTIQDQIIRLIRSLAKEMNMAMVLITHNFGAVAGSVDRVIVMYAGRIVESGTTEMIFHSPRHPYTRALLKSIPSVAGQGNRRLHTIPGHLPNPLNQPRGCSFMPRCTQVMDKCNTAVPQLLETESGHQAACWRLHP